MELCKTCKNKNCTKQIIVEESTEIKILKCLEYKKNENKIKGYKKPLERTAKIEKSVMGLYNPSWD